MRITNEVKTDLAQLIELHLPYLLACRVKEIAGVFADVLYEIDQIERYGNESQHIEGALI